MDTTTAPETAAAPAAAPAKDSLATILFVVDDNIAVLNGKIAVGYDRDAKAPRGTTLLVVGRDLKQDGFSGLHDALGKVCVGPADPIYVAANLAYQDGATKIVIKGVPEDIAAIEAVEAADGKPAVEGKPGTVRRARLQTYFDMVKDKITVSFA